MKKKLSKDLSNNKENLKIYKTRRHSLKDLYIVIFLTILSLAILIIPINKFVANSIIHILYIVSGFLIIFLSGFAFWAALIPLTKIGKSKRLILTLLFVIVILTGFYYFIKWNPLNGLNIMFLIILSAFIGIMCIIACLRRMRISKIKKHYSEQDTHLNEAIPIKNETPENDKKSESLEKKKTHFISLDLILIFFITILTTIFIVTPKLNDTFVRTILGLFLILFIPGYSLIAALFPKKDDLDGIERVALSFGLSIAVTPLIGLALNYTSYGIRLTPILISLSAFTIIMVFIAYIRRRRVQYDEKFYVNFAGFYNSIKGMFRGESKTSKILSIVLIISILLAIGTTAYIIIKPKQGETFTEFYILGPEGQASDYPTNITVGQNASVIIGIVNHEQGTVNYNLVITSNGNVMGDQNITLTNGNKTEIPYTFTESTAGNKEIQFFLYKLPDNTNIYRSLHLFVQVT